jgi:hypothetical protein
MKSIKILLLSLVCIVSSTAFATMDIAQFEALAGKDQSRCTKGVALDYCRGELKYGLDQGLISQRSYNWGYANGYYPVIDRNNNIGAICKCGCFEASTNISVWSEEAQKVVEIAAKNITKANQLIGLSSDATLSSLTTDDFAIKTITHGEEMPELYVFSLEDGTQLKVTQHHGMLLSSGEMVAAKDVDLSHSFISANSQRAIKIVDINREKTNSEVYNFETESEDKISHIIVAEGIYVGDLIWQNQLADELGAITLRQ